MNEMLYLFDYETKIQTTLRDGKVIDVCTEEVHMSRKPLIAEYLGDHKLGVYFETGEYRIIDLDLQLRPSTMQTFKTNNTFSNVGVNKWGRIVWPNICGITNDEAYYLADEAKNPERLVFPEELEIVDANIASDRAAITFSCKSQDSMVWGNKKIICKTLYNIKRIKPYFYDDVDRKYFDFKDIDFYLNEIRPQALYYLCDLSAI